MSGPYEGVHAYPDGEATVARHALTAAEYGYEGVVVRNHGDSPVSYDPQAVADTYDIDVVTGVEVRAEDPSRVAGFVGSHREDVTVVAVHGGAQAVNRFAASDPRVDVLAHPTREAAFDHVHAKEAAANGVRVEVDLSGVVGAAGGKRVRRLQRLRRLVDVLEHFETPYVVSVDPTSHLDLRAPRDLAALGDLVGLSVAQVRDGLAEWGRVAARNRAVHERGVAEGVWLDPDREGVPPGDRTGS